MWLPASGREDGIIGSQFNSGALVFFFYIKTPLPSPQMGRSHLLLKQNVDLENRHDHHPKKEVNSLPSPLGEGQTDMPINYLNQGEVRPRSNHRITSCRDATQPLAQHMEALRASPLPADFHALRKDFSPHRSPTLPISAGEYKPGN